MKFNKKNIVTAIDIGTSKICVFIGQVDYDNLIQIIGHGVENLIGINDAPIEGAVCKGEIVNMKIVKEVLSKAIQKAEESSNTTINQNKLLISVTGAHVKSARGQGVVMIDDDENGERQITDEHINNAMTSAQNISLEFENFLINKSESYFVIDDQRRTLEPLKQIGCKLEAYAHLIYGDRNRVGNFKSIIRDVGFDEDPQLVFSGLASAYGVLSDEEQENGVLLIDFGAGTTEVLVVKNKGILYSKVIAIGLDHVINDLSIGLELHPSKTRNLLMNKDSYTLDDNSVIEVDNRNIPMDSIEKIINLRIRELFEIIHKDLVDKKHINNLDAGIVLTGGGALFTTNQEELKAIFDIPVRVGIPRDISGAVTSFDSPRYSTVCGLLRYGLSDNELDRNSSLSFFDAVSTWGSENVKSVLSVFGKVKGVIKF